VAADRQPASGGRFLQAGAIYVVGTALTQGLGLIALPIATRVLGVHEFGVAGTATAISALLVIVYSLGLNFTIVRFVYDDPAGAKRTRWAALLRLQAVAATLLAAIVFATGPLWSGLLSDFGWNGAFKLAVVAALAATLQTTVMGVLRASHRPVMYLVVLASQLTVGLGLGLALATRWGAAGYVGGLAIGNAVALAIGFAATYRRPAWDRTLPREGLRVSLPAMTHQLALWGMDLSDRLLIAAYLSVADVARYQIAYVAGSILLLLLSAVQQAWAPAYMSEPEEARTLLPGALTFAVTQAALGAVALLIVVAPLVLDVLAPASFESSLVVLAVVAATTLPRAGYLMSVIALVDRKKTSRMATASGLGAALNVGANLIVIPAFGLVGAASTTLAANVVMAVIVIAAAQRIIGVRLPILPLVAVWAVGTAVAVGLAHVPDEAGWLPLRAAIGVAAAAWLLFQLRVVRDQFRRVTAGTSPYALA
jgi:O-antigen/teichoic acid export membrane protein